MTNRYVSDAFPPDVRMRVTLVDILLGALAGAACGLAVTVTIFRVIHWMVTP